MSETTVSAGLVASEAVRESLSQAAPESSHLPSVPKLPLFIIKEHQSCWTRAHPITSSDFDPLQRPYFRARSRLQLLEVRTSAPFVGAGGGTTQFNS